MECDWVLVAVQKHADLRSSHADADDTGNDHEVRWIAGHILACDIQKISARDVGRARPRSLGRNRKQLLAVMARLELEGWLKLTCADPAS